MKIIWCATAALVLSLIFYSESFISSTASNFILSIFLVLLADEGHLSPSFLPNQRAFVSIFFFFFFFLADLTLYEMPCLRYTADHTLCKIATIEPVGHSPLFRCPIYQARVSNRVLVKWTVLIFFMNGTLQL